MRKPTLEGSPRDPSAQRRSPWEVAITVRVVVLVPVPFNPNAIILYVGAAFDPVKFKLLMQLSAGLLAGVLGATLLGAKFQMVPVLLPALAFLAVSTLSTLFSGDIVHSLIGAVPYRYDGLLSL